MVDQDVAGPDLGEDVGGLVLVGGWRRAGTTGTCGGALRSGRSRSTSCQRAVRSSIPATSKQSSSRTPMPLDQDLAGDIGHRALHLEADRLAEAPTADLLLDREQQVVGLVLLDRDVGVARDPEQVGLEDLHAPEQLVEVGLDDLVEEHELVALDREQARQAGRDLDPGEADLAGVRVPQADRDRERQRADVRERVARVHGERREHREDLVVEAAPEVLVVLGDVVVVDDRHALGGELGAGSRPRWPRARRPASRTRSRMASSCWKGVMPSDDTAVAPARTWRRRPDTRTWKNSSRLLAKMARNFTRSSSGLRASRASWRTRALNSSHDSSRLRIGRLLVAPDRRRPRPTRGPGAGRTVAMRPQLVSGGGHVRGARRGRRPGPGRVPEHTTRALRVRGPGRLREACRSSRGSPAAAQLRRPATGPRDRVVRHSPCPLEPSSWLRFSPRRRTAARPSPGPPRPASGRPARRVHEALLGGLEPAVRARRLAAARHRGPRPVSSAWSDR